MDRGALLHAGGPRPAGRALAGRGAGGGRAASGGPWREVWGAPVGRGAPMGRGAGEAGLEVRMDLARGVERGAAAMHGPGAHFVLAHREERLQAEQAVARVNQAVEPRLADAGAREILGPFVP